MVEIEAEACAFMTGEFGTCSMQEYEEALCFGDVGSVAEGGWVAVA